MLLRQTRPMYMTTPIARDLCRVYPSHAWYLCSKLEKLLTNEDFVQGEFAYYVENSMALCQSLCYGPPGKVIAKVLTTDRSISKRELFFHPGERVQE
jgi:hypothetical protein